jgi:hypothetical protein
MQSSGSHYKSSATALTGAAAAVAVPFAVTAAGALTLTAAVCAAGLIVVANSICGAGATDADDDEAALPL